VLTAVVPLAVDFDNPSQSQLWQAFAIQSLKGYFQFLDQVFVSMPVQPATLRAYRCLNFPSLLPVILLRKVWIGSFIDILSITYNFVLLLIGV
jgi:hypothetical protein